MSDKINAVVAKVSRDDTEITYASTSRNSAVVPILVAYMSGAKGKWELSVTNQQLTQEEFDAIRESFDQTAMGNLMAADAGDLLEESALEAQADLPSAEGTQDDATS